MTANLIRRLLPMFGLAAPPASAASRVLDSIGARIERGRVSVELPSGTRHTYDTGKDGIHAVFMLRDGAALRRFALGGDVGVAEAYMDGQWDTPDLTALLLFGISNEQAIGGLWQGNALIRMTHGLRHRLRRNSRAGSKRNIAYHYDLGNNFYRLWLDETMTYSSGLRKTPHATLAEAQHAKLRAMAETAQVKPGMKVLEIGCGWGSMAATLAQDYGCHVTCLTLSQEQQRYVRERAAREGWADRVEVLLQDYRDVQGAFDAIVSVEMFEAVGEAYWPAFFRTVHDRLKPGGTAAVQTITLAEERFEEYRRGGDFIQTYVFPGGMLPSLERFADHATATGLQSSVTRTFGQDYAWTLMQWNKRFQHAWPEIAAQGFDTRFKRMWEFYLSYCAAGFMDGRIDVAQVALRHA